MSIILNGTTGIDAGSLPVINCGNTEVEDEEIQAEITVNLVNEAKNYLAQTDYKMTVDYFATLDKASQDELIAERQKAREFIRSNS